MSHTIVQIVISGIALLVLVAIEAYRYSNCRVTRTLREHFGPECDKALGYQRIPDPAETTETSGKSTEVIAASMARTTR